MALTHRYIDYSGGENSNGGASAGDAWQTISHAYSTITNANSWQLNLKDNADHVVSGPILPSYNPGWGTEDKAIHHVGYTSVANDGGRWTIDCNGAQYINSTSYDNLHFYNGKFKNWSTGRLIRLDDCVTLYGIEFDGQDTARDCFQLDNYNLVANCWLHSMDTSNTATTYPFYVLSACGIIGNRVEVTQKHYGIRCYWGCHVSDNLILSSNSTTSGTPGMIVIINGDLTTLANNIIYSLVDPNQSYGIYLGWGSTGNLRIFNNYVQGMKRNFYYGSGIQFNIKGGNVSYGGNTSDFYTHASNDQVLTLSDDVVLTQSGLMDPENGDYRPNALLREQGIWPSWGNDYSNNQVGLFNKSVGYPQPRQNFREDIQALKSGLAIL